MEHHIRRRGGQAWNSAARARVHIPQDRRVKQPKERTMRQALLMSAAALALAASTSMSLAQKEGGAPGASGMSAPAGTTAPAANPSGATVPRTGAPGAAQSEPSESPAPKATAPGGNRGAQDRTIPEKQKSTQQAPSAQPTPKQGQTGKSMPRQGENAGTSTTHESQGTTGTGTSQRAMTSKNVSLTTEQKSTIRSRVLTASAPRIDRVDFDIRVGSVVPRTVRVAPVPQTIVEIEPAWRGFMYFVRADEIVIVDPRTLEIVAVLDV